MYIKFYVGPNEEATIQELHQYLFPMNPIRFKRSEATKVKLKGENEHASQKRSKVLKEMKQNKGLFDFFMKPRNSNKHIKACVHWGRKRLIT